MKIRIDSAGNLVVADPRLLDLELLRAIYPEYEIAIAELPGFTSPRFLQSREKGCGIAFYELPFAPESELWELHRATMQELGNGNLGQKQQDEASVMDLKIELSWRLLYHCRLCGHRCGVDRARGELGICRLKSKAIVANAFVHIAEEPPINPSLLISLAGCGLRCRYCQQWELLDPECPGQPLEASLWHSLPTDGARSLSFIGGNPDESLHAILRFLADAPCDWSLPVVWNSHGYGSPEAVRLLDGIIDAYVPDFKYGRDECGIKLSGAPGYPEVAREAIKAMLAQGVPVMVRILLLPCHSECCNKPVLEKLASMESEYLYVSINGQYWPHWKITSSDGRMAEPTPPEEVQVVHDLARDLGLQLIE